MLGFLIAYSYVVDLGLPGKSSPDSVSMVSTVFLFVLLPVLIMLFVDSGRRSRMQYGVTDRRILILGEPQAGLKSLPLGDAAAVRLSERSGAEGTITFTDSKLALELIDDVERVHGLLQEAQRAGSAIPVALGRESLEETHRQLRPVYGPDTPVVGAAWPPDHRCRPPAATQDPLRRDRPAHPDPARAGAVVARPEQQAGLTSLALRELDDVDLRLRRNGSGSIAFGRRAPRLERIEHAERVAGLIEEARKGAQA
jgi:hypothetical protein